MRKSVSLYFFGLFLPFFLGAETKAKLEPIFPAEIPGLIFLEAEDAFSTNFAKEPIQDFSSSGLRLLQLNKAPQAPGAPFFFDFSFYVDEDGDYELWLAGTPPGPKDELLPSYSSPIRLLLDGKSPVPIYRENVVVVESYSLTNFWSQVKNKVTLTKGIHTLRIEVGEKRRFDNRFYFYLDCLFLLKSTTSTLSSQLVPQVFPKDRNNRSFDNPYLTISQYEGVIQNKPRELPGYMDLAKVYSILGDYSNSLKVLNRARLIAPTDNQILLLQAKNRLWSGDTEEGLRLFQEYLKSDTENLGLWAEAAKVSAWLGKYSQSLELYQQAQKIFPNDLGLQVNFGLTYLWSNRVKEGAMLLDSLWDLVKTNENGIKELGQIYRLNGYPEKALEIYLKAVQAFPGSLDFLLLLEETYLRKNDLNKAQEVKKTILDRFETSDRLTSYLEIFELKETLRQKALDDFKSRLSQNPDDLKLREEMVQAYFWNGKKDEAIDETQNILVNRLYRQIQSFEKQEGSLLGTLDKLYAIIGFLSRAKGLTETNLKELQQLMDQPSATPESLTSQSVLATRLIENLEAAFTNSESLVPVIDTFEKDNLELKKLVENHRPWIWNLADVYQELNAASRRSVPLADYLLARLNLYEKNFSSARKWLEKIQSQENPSFLPLANQGTLWTLGTLDPSSINKNNYYPNFASITSLISNLDENASPQRPVTEPGSLVSALKEYLPRIQQIWESNQRTILSLHNILLTRTALQFYQYDLETTEFRYQLGDYYLSRGKNFEARRQLEKFMALNPGNISGKFSLGRARQLSGDWAGAMALFKNVYQTDPKYENSASLHNQLAKQHPDRFNGTLRTFYDDSRTTTQGRLEFQASGSSLLSLSGAYTIDMLRLYQDTVEENPSTTSLHTLELSLPFTFNDFGLSIYGLGGGTLRNDLLENYSPIGAPFIPTDLLSQVAVSPLAGAGFKFIQNNLNITLDYRFAQVQDTFVPGRLYHFANSGELNASYLIDLGTSSAFRSLTTRVFGKTSQVFNNKNQDTNGLYTGLLESVFGFHLADAPWTNLSIVASGSWEDSTIPQEKNYYAPDQVLILKSGILVNSWLGLGPDWVLGIGLRGSLGFYQSKTFKTPEPYMLSEGFGRLELTKGDLSLFLDLGGNQANDGAGLGYWSLQAQLGVIVSVPDYLIP